MKIFSILQLCNFASNRLLVVLIGAFLFASCGKESVGTNDITPKETKSSSLSFEEFVKSRYPHSIQADLAKAGLRNSTCEPSDYGLVCPGPSLTVTEIVTIASTGCQFSVKLEVTECYLPGILGSYVTFRLIDWEILNASTAPCSTYWNWLIALPNPQFNDELDALEDELTSKAINQFMGAYVLSNPVNGNCDQNYFYHAAFFRPMCTMRCQGKNETYPYFANVVCSTDGCCVKVTHYCVKDGIVVEIGPVFEQISACSDFFPAECPRKMEPASWCRTSSCLVQ